MAWSLIPGSDDKFTCANCGRSFPNFTSAMREHASCQTWSCRHLYDYHSVFQSLSGQESDTGLRSVHCKLCDYRGPMLDQADETTHLKHAETHALRTCEQLIFHNLEDFTQHMMQKHGLSENFEVDSSEPCWDSLPWARVQHLEILKGRHLLRLSRPWIEGKLCQSRYGGYTCIFLDQDKRGETTHPLDGAVPHESNKTSDHYEGTKMAAAHGGRRNQTVADATEACNAARRSDYSTRENMFASGIEVA